MTRGRGAARTQQARRGAQVPRAGIRVPPPAGRATCRAARPARARAHPGGARAPRAPLTRSWARPPPRPRFRRALSLVAAGGRPEGNDPLQGPKGPGTRRPGRQRGRDPPRRARAAAEGCGRVLPTLRTGGGGGRRGALGSSRSSERGEREGGREREGGGEGREEGAGAGGGARRGGRGAPELQLRARCAPFCPPGRAAVPALLGLAVTPEGAGQGGGGGRGWVRGALAPGSSEKGHRAGRLPLPLQTAPWVCLPDSQMGRGAELLTCNVGSMPPSAPHPRPVASERLVILRKLPANSWE